MVNQVKRDDNDLKPRQTLWPIEYQFNVSLY